MRIGLALVAIALLVIAAMVLGFRGLMALAAVK